MRTVRRISLLLPVVVLLSGLPVAQFRTKPHVALHALAARSAAIVKAPGDFRMAGVSWDPSGATPTNIRIRTSTNGKHWTSWTELGDTEISNAHSTEPVWVGHARFAEIRYDGRDAKNVKLNVIDPGANPTAPASTAEASVGAPPIYTRQQWGADESIRRGPPHYAEPLQMIFVHHTATTNSYSKSDSAAIVRSIYVYHVKTNGWDDIGYNFLVDRYGQIFEGRYGGMTRSVIGAHTLGFNEHSAGIALIGTFNSTGATSAAMSALQRLIAWRMDVAYINPAGHTVMTSGGNPRYPAGTKVTLNTISGHRDVYDTDCPGQLVYNALPGIRPTIAKMGDPKLYGPHLSTPVVTPNGDGVADSVQFTSYFSSAVNWTVKVLDSAGNQWFSSSGSGINLSTTWNGRNPAGAIAPHDYYRFVVNASNAHGKINPVQIQFAVWSFPDGTLFGMPNGWSGILMNGKLRHLVAFNALQTRYAVAERVAAPSTLLSYYPAGADIGFRDGVLVNDGSATYLIADEKRHPIDAATMSDLGFNPQSVIKATAASLAPTPPGAAVTSNSYPDGSAIYSTSDDEAMYVNGLAHPFTTNVRRSYQITDAQLAGPADTQVMTAQTLPPLPFRDGTLIRQGSDPTVYVIADGKRFSFPSRHMFDLMGYNLANVRSATAAEVALTPDAGAL